MGLHSLDWVILAGYMLISLGIGFVLRKRAGKGLSSYFLSGRSFPWWLAGTSIVATTFAADTPLAVTGFVAKNGIAGNWFWWLTCLSTMTVAFFFARWWRRSKVLTDVEFIEIRYSGKSAAVLRGFSALYRGLLLNAIKLGFVMVAMAKVIDAVFAVDKETALLVSLGVILAYSVMSGFWGVVVTDFLQFFVAMAGSIAFAVVALRHVGGIGGLESGLIARFGVEGTNDLLTILPPAGSMWMPFFTLFVYLGIMWWADARVEGGAYVAQRIMSTKNEKHATAASLWFNFAHIALRPWPWIIVALVSLVVFPNIQDKESGFPLMMNAVLPIGLKGLMVTAFFAAFMSTVDTLINWGSSYLVNDFYKRFIARERRDKHYVIVSKLCEVGLLTMGYLISRQVDSVVGMWKLLAALTSGLGVIYVARWFWWRVNAWSEVAAMVASGVATFVLNAYTSMDFAHKICIIVPASAVAWISVTFLTKPVAMDKLTAFYRRVRPYPFFWKPVLANIADPAERVCPDDFWVNARSWVWGVVAVYSLLFAIGKWIFWRVDQAAILTGICALMCYLLYREMKPSKAIVAEAVPVGEPVAETD